MRIVCGLDVHKDSVFACILNENGEKFECKFGVLTPELEELHQLLLTHDVKEVTMESTSIYWHPIWRVLDDIEDLKLVNPYFIKQLPGRKSDVRDAAWIAECTMKDLIRGSFVPSTLVQRMRQYNRRIFDLNKEIVYKLTKLDSVLQRCNIRISNYVSSVDSKSYKEVVRLVSEGVTDPNRLASVIHGRTINRVGKETITASLTGVISEVDIDLIRQYLEEIELAQRHKQESHEKLTRMCEDEFPKEFENLQTIPGVKERSATSILAEIGADMKMFITASALVSWCGLKPRNEESAGKIKSRRITHGNKYIRKTMIECAWGASKTQNCFFSKYSYTQTVVRKKNAMKVKVAIARKMLTAIWHVLSEGKPYTDYKKPDTKGNS
ncbi:IS110 family transposase [Phocaeicola vulgatus]|uniref:IS110 family transposase n=1 Tax=Phocaeicola vulgatus TaxID=821 RepID=A0A415BT52_PHOVU|nr:IS110 family transposase [Phocaeicola vulgatus]RHI92734.1 IS110 family transposase [Phocaeicola vulgatus]